MPLVIELNSRSPFPPFPSQRELNSRSPFPPFPSQRSPPGPPPYHLFQLHPKRSPPGPPPYHLFPLHPKRKKMIRRWAWRLHHSPRSRPQRSRDARPPTCACDCASRRPGGSPPARRAFRISCTRARARRQRHQTVRVLTISLLVLLLALARRRPRPQSLLSAHTPAPAQLSPPPPHRVTLSTHLGPTYSAPRSSRLF